MVWVDLVECHLWTIKMVRNAVEKGVISAADYKEITGEDFEE